MGILADLFVEIRGDDSKLKSTLAGVKDLISSASGGDIKLGGQGAANGAVDAARAIRVAMTQAMEPIRSLGSTFIAQFNRMETVVTTLAQKIDASFKFPRAEKRFSELYNAGRTATNGITKLFNEMLTKVNFHRLESINRVLGANPLKGIKGSHVDGVPQGVIGSYSKLVMNISGIAPAARVADRAVRHMHRGLLLATGTASGLGALFMGFRKATLEASHLNETVNKMEVIFGTNSFGVVTAEADKMASEFGIVKSTFLDMAASFGGLLQGMGGKFPAESAKISSELTNLSAEITSLLNIPFDQVGEKVASALRGESEPIRALNVDVSEAAIEQEALRLGLSRTSGELSTQQKVTARTSLVTKGLQIAVGDLRATQGGFANASREAWGRIENTLAAAGQIFMPIVERMMGGVNGLLKTVENWVNESKPMIDGWVNGIMVGMTTVDGYFGMLGSQLGELTQSIVSEMGSWTIVTDAVSGAWEFLKDSASVIFESIGYVIRNFSLLVQSAALVIVEKITNVGEVLSWLMGAAGTFGNYLGNNWVNLIRDAAAGAWSILSNLGNNIIELFKAAWAYLNGKGFKPNYTSLLDGFKAAAEKLPDIAKPAFTKLTKEFDEIAGKIGANEAKRLTDKAQIATGVKEMPKGPFRPGLQPGQEIEKSKKHASFDLSEFSKHLQEGSFGKGNAVERTAKSSEQILAEAKAMVKNTQKLLDKKEPAKPGFAVP